MPSYVTGNTAMIKTAVNDPAVGGAASGYFAVDLDALPGLRTDLEAVRDRYNEIQRDADDLRHIPAPGQDEISMTAARELGELAGNEPGQLGWCAREAAMSVQAMIDEVDALLGSYRNAEDSSVMDT